MEKQIRHDGIIEAIEGCHVSVRILQTSACAGCKIASHCLTAEAKKKIIDVLTTSTAAVRWKVGQQVVVSTEGSMAGRALLISFGLPLLLMLAVLAVAMAAGCSEGATALIMLGSLVPYYLIVWLLRDRIAQKIAFRIEEQARENKLNRNN